MIPPTYQCGSKRRWSSGPSGPTSPATSPASANRSGARAIAVLAALATGGALALAGCHGGSSRRATAAGARRPGGAGGTALHDAGTADAGGTGLPPDGGNPAVRAAVQAHARDLLRTGRYAAAEPMLEALWRTGGDADARTDGLLAATALARTGHDDAALALLHEAEGRKLPHRHLEDLAAAIASDTRDPAALAARLAKTPSTVATDEGAALVGALYQRAGRPRLAIPFWEQAARLSPNEGVYWRQLMRLYAVTGHPNRLEHALERVVALQPTYVPARIDLVRILDQRGHPAEAKAIAVPPAKIYKPLDQAVITGEVLLRAGLAKDAIAAYRHALTLDHDACRARLGLARARLAAGEVRAGERALYDLVAHRVDGRPCDVAEASRTLLTDPRTKKTMRRRLEHLARHGGGADPGTLGAVLGRTGPATHRHATGRR